jgi:hypothetical protein
MTAPLADAIVSGTAILVTANASDSVGVTSVQFKLDGTNIGSAFTAAPYGGVWDSTTVADGSHTLTAVASDPAGYQTTAKPVTVVVSNLVSALGLPTVTILASAPNASRVGLIDGAFTLTRTGSTSAALTVNYFPGGTAANGIDYSTLGTTATIPAGAASATITIAPLSSANYVGSQTVVFTLSSNLAYTVDSPNSGTMTIAGNGVRCSIGRAPGNNIKITWGSVVGKAYRVAYKNSMSNATWTNMSPLTTATSTTTSYTDTTANKSTKRYYVVYVTD